MPRISFDTLIHAPVEICFDLARDIDFHQRSMAHTGERAISGVTQGLIGLGEEVTWQATHFGIRQRLTSRITVYERPVRFCDTMVSGAFKRFHHEHNFVDRGSHTVMTDTFDYTSPLGPLGWLADRVFLESYMRRLLTARCEAIKAEAEKRVACKLRAK